MSKLKILICGASGFIGRSVFEGLEDNKDHVITGSCLNIPDYPGSFIGANLTTQDDVDNLMDRDWDVVIHAAAITDGYGAVHADPAKYISGNIIMNTLLGKAALKYKIPKFIFMSCATVYPHFLDRPVTEEDTVFKPEDLHPKYFGGAWVKLSAENTYRYFSALGDTKFIIVRHSNIYGPHDKFEPVRSHVLAATIHKVMQAPDNGKITIWGDGTEKRDFLYSADLAHFIRLVILNMDNWQSKFEIFNVGQGYSITVSDMAEKVIALSGKNLGINYDIGMPTVQSKLVMNIDKAKKIGWQPLCNLTYGLSRTINWYRQNII